MIGIRRSTASAEVRADISSATPFPAGTEMDEGPVDMNAIATIERVLGTLSKGRLMESMVDVPPPLSNPRGICSGSGMVSTWIWSGWTVSVAPMRTS